MKALKQESVANALPALEACPMLNPHRSRFKPSPYLGVLQGASPEQQHPMRAHNLPEFARLPPEMGQTGEGAGCGFATSTPKQCST